MSLCFIVHQSSAQLFIERTSDSTWRFVGEVGIVTGSYTYDQFAPDFYLEGFRLQLKKGIYYRKENEKNTFRISLITSTGQIHHVAKQFYEVKDTVNLDGRWNNTGVQLGFEHNLYDRKNFRFYAGSDFVYRKHKFSGTGKSMYNEMNFQQKINSYGVGTELFLGVRFNITEKIKLSLESAYSIVLINENRSRIYPQSAVGSSNNALFHFSVEPSPFNQISLGYKF